LGQTAKKRPLLVNRGEDMGLVELPTSWRLVKPANMGRQYGRHRPGFTGRFPTWGREMVEELPVTHIRHRISIPYLMITPKGDKAAVGAS
jgi:hypothetical protein